MPLQPTSDADMVVHTDRLLQLSRHGKVWDTMDVTLIRYMAVIVILKILQAIIIMTITINTSSNMHKNEMHIFFFYMQRNTFQVVIAKGGSQTYLIFLYRQIQWTTGDASGGRNGLGGRVAQVGYSSANGMGSMSLPGTGTSAVCNLPSLSNNGFRGVFVFRVHGGDLMDVQSFPQPIGM